MNITTECIVLTLGTQHILMTYFLLTICTKIFKHCQYTSLGQYTSKACTDLEAA